MRSPDVTCFILWLTAPPPPPLLSALPRTAYARINEKASQEAKWEQSKVVQQIEELWLVGNGLELLTRIPYVGSMFEPETILPTYIHILHGPRSGSEKSLQPASEQVTEGTVDKASDVNLSVKSLQHLVRANASTIEKLEQQVEKNVSTIQENRSHIHRLGQSMKHLDIPHSPEPKSRRSTLTPMLSSSTKKNSTGSPTR